MKVKKIQLLRPEAEVSFSKERPIISRCYFVFAVLPRMIKVIKSKIDLEIPSAIHNHAGTVYRHRVWFVCIPKIKVVQDE